MSPVVEEVAAGKEIVLDMYEVEEVDFDISKVKVGEAVEADVVAMAVVVEAVEEEIITIVTTTI